MSEVKATLSKPDLMAGSMGRAVTTSLALSIIRAARKAISHVPITAGPMIGMGSLKVGSGKTGHSKSLMAKAGLLSRAIIYRFGPVLTRFSKLSRRALVIIRTFLAAPAITRIGKVTDRGRVMAAALTPVFTTGPLLTGLGRVVLMGMAMVGALGRSIGRVMSLIDSRANIGKCLIAGRVTTFLAATGIARKARVTSSYSRLTGFV